MTVQDTASSPSQLTAGKVLHDLSSDTPAINNFEEVIVNSAKSGRCRTFAEVAGQSMLLWKRANWREEKIGENTRTELCAL